MEFLELLAKAAGLSPTTLLILGFIACLAFLLALREFATWYLRIFQVQKSLQAVQEDLEKTREDLQNLRVQLASQEPSKAQPVAAPQDTSKKDRFTLSH
tara:strand:- start:8680 stop:8976 length:297 start_codon:yes stop_codon:yes gene_type:complete